MTPEDRILLEKAAKALDWIWIEGPPDDRGIQLVNWQWWNPLRDNGEALQLALDLDLAMDPFPYLGKVKTAFVVQKRRASSIMREENPMKVMERYGSDRAAAARRAIVRVAALLGEAP